jgi:hypothetical protein
MDSPTPSRILDPTSSAVVKNVTDELAEIGLNNMASYKFDALALSLNRSSTGCSRAGALPVGLANHDLCLPGFQCAYASIATFRAERIMVTGTVS